MRSIAALVNRRGALPFPGREKLGAIVAFQDRNLTCRDCGAEFAFTAGEQEFYAQKGFEHEPTRCPQCRRARKRDRSGAGGERTMFDTICSQCGQATQVPFSPRPDKPVYCPDCYKSVAGRRSR